MNQCPHTIIFDFEIFFINVNFFDTNVFVRDNGKLKTKVFSKPTDHQDFLHRRLEYPESLRKNIPYRQLLRGKQICSQHNDFESYYSKLTDSFRKRGYTKNDLTTHIERANAIPRKTILVQTPKAQNDRLSFITTYDRTNPNIKDVLQKHWLLLQLDPHLGVVFQSHQ